MTAPEVERLIKAWDQASRRDTMLPYLGTNTCGEVADLLATTQRELAEANERWDHFQKLASDHRDELERELAEARAEAERWAAQALKEEECRIAWQAERDRLAARLSEYNRWPDPLQSPQAEAIRNGKIDMTEIVSLFDKMERELEQLRLVAADNARLRESLEPFAERYDAWGDAAKTAYSCEDYSPRLVADLARARAALQKEPQP